jgi:hypothetical protein
MVALVEGDGLVGPV